MEAKKSQFEHKICIALSVCFHVRKLLPTSIEETYSSNNVGKKIMQAEKKDITFTKEMCIIAILNTEL